MDLRTKDSQHILWILLLVLVVGVTAFVNFSKKTSRDVSAPDGSSPTAIGPSDGVVVTVGSTESDRSPANSLSKGLPEGFPNNVPVEVSNIAESYKAVYKNQNNITQYTVSYTSKSSVATLWDLYANFMRKEGYTLDNAVTNKKLGSITGTKDGNMVSAIISSSGALSLVQLNLLYK